MERRNRWGISPNESVSGYRGKPMRISSCETTRMRNTSGVRNTKTPIPLSRGQRLEVKPYVRCLFVSFEFFFPPYAYPPTNEVVYFSSFWRNSYDAFRTWNVLKMFFFSFKERGNFSLPIASVEQNTNWIMSHRYRPINSEKEHPISWNKVDQ